jgi:hypothetical protein
MIIAANLLIFKPKLGLEKQTRVRTVHTAVMSTVIERVRKFSIYQLVDDENALSPLANL